MGVMPVRSATTRHRDSGQHLLYLRISTPNDPPDAKPYSLLQVARDREAERKRVKLLRQDPEYKIKKKEKMEIILAINLLSFCKCKDCNQYSSKKILN